MTSKSSSSLSNPNEWYSNYQVGDDGPVETVNGRTRDKWNKYDAVFWRQTRSKGQYKYNGAGPYDIWADGSRTPPTYIGNNDILTLYSRLSEAVKGHSFNLAVAAAEGSKTVSMVTKAVTDIGGALLDLKRGKFESAARRFGVSRRSSHLSEKDVAGRWLELQYGWKPLLSDIYESAKAYEALTSPPRKNRISVSIRKSTPWDSSASPSLFSFKGVIEERSRIIYEMTETLSAPRSLGLTDPLSVAWELVPYSFVVDWFVPIGSYLENLNTIPSLQGRFLRTNTKRFSSAAVWANVFSGYSFPRYPQANYSFYSMSRTPLVSLAVPKPQFESFSEAMSPSRIWNSIALVTQRLR